MSEKGLEHSTEYILYNSARRGMKILCTYQIDFNNFFKGEINENNKRKYWLCRDGCSC